MRKINNIGVSVIYGNIAKLSADAVVVPEFRESASYSGVGGILCINGYEEGLKNYSCLLDNMPDLPFGEVIHTQSGRPSIPFMLHAVCIGAPKGNAFQIISICVEKALSLAQSHQYKKILMPALGREIFDCLTDKEAALAILNGVARLNVDTTKEMEVVIVIHYKRIQKETFERVLESFDPSALFPEETGERAFDPMISTDATEYC